MPDGMQLVDREILNTSSSDPSLWGSAMLFVDDGKDYTTLENLSTTDVHAHNHSSAGVVIDIEWTKSTNRHSPGVNQVLFHTVNAKQF